MKGEDINDMSLNRPAQFYQRKDTQEYDLEGTYNNHTGMGFADQQAGNLVPMLQSFPGQPLAQNGFTYIGLTPFVLPPAQPAAPSFLEAGTGGSCAPLGMPLNYFNQEQQFMAGHYQLPLDDKLPSDNKAGDVSKP